MKFKSSLIILLVVITLVAAVAHTFAAPSANSERSEPINDSAFEAVDVMEPLFEEPLPCTNSRYKAWYGCS